MNHALSALKSRPAGRRRAGWLGRLACLLFALSAGNATAQAVPASALEATTSMQAWLKRMADGSRQRSYTGTFVVSSSSSLSSARIWHVCEGPEQVERVDTLTGTPRSVFRHNDQVTTFWPDTGLARSEKRESLAVFPNRLRGADADLADHYKLLTPGQIERVAGVPAELFVLQPRDKLRFAYRVWLEPQSALVVKLQTLDGQGQVLEQAAFSELQLGAPLKLEALLRMMNRLEGYRLEKVQPVRTSLEAEGWALKKTAPAGFDPLYCHSRADKAAAKAGLHCVFSDGLASVSVFLETLPTKTEPRDAQMAMGATHTLRTHVHQHAATLMGEVPPATLKLFASALERRRASP